MTELKRNKKDRSMQLVFLCWLAYMSSYIGRLGYTANKLSVASVFDGCTDASLGLVWSMFSLAYGIGQVFNGLMCKKYNVKYVIFGALTVSALSNVAMALTPSFASMKYIWLVNGAACSCLWTSLIRLISETVSDMYMDRAIIVMGTPIAVGNTLMYGVSSMFSALGMGYSVSFYVAAATLVITASVWILRYDRTVDPLLEQKRMSIDKREEGAAARRGFDVALLPLLGVFVFFAVSNNFVKDGLTTWMPEILNDMYGIVDWLSILLALSLPILSIFGVFAATFIRRYIKDFSLDCVVLYAAASLFLIVVMLTLSKNAMPVAVTCFALTACMMSGVNNIVTSVLPLKLKDRANSGMLSGVLNGFCYLGTTVCSYGLGAISDGFGWSAVIYVVFGVCVAMVLVGGIFSAYHFLTKRS